MDVQHVWHRKNAIWPFTVVGRPPQEDTTFGQLIHELTDPIIPSVIPGVEAVHAVDAAGVHPLLLAVGSERYVPYEEARRPQELHTLANALLGHGQLSLAKYLLIVAGEDNPDLDPQDVGELDLTGVQMDTSILITAIKTVFQVPFNWAPDRRELATYLMVPACFKVYVQQVIAIE